MIRKVLLLCCLVLLVRADEIFTEEQYAELDILPGLDFVGFGYDARFDTASSALQVPVMEFSFSKAKSFAYPTLRELSYKVPDEIYVRNVAFTEAQAYLYNSLTEYKSKLALDIGIDFEQLTGTYANNQTCISANGTAPNCTTTGTSSNEQIFSIGATVGFVKESFKSVESYLVENSEKTQLYHIFLDSRFIRPEVKEDLRILSNVLFDDNRPLYIKFLEKYGTHYVVSATMGGQVTMMSSIAKTLNTDSTTTSAGVSGGQSSSQSLSQSDALASASKTFASSLNAKVDFSFSTVNTNIELQTTSQWRLLGGNSSIVNLLDSRNSSAAIRSWKETITSNPVPVGYRLREISTLFDDPFMRQQLATAVSAFLNIDTSDILELENWVPLPRPVKRAANPVMELWESYKAEEKARAVAE